ncbi:MAG: hypothetical protein QF704_11560 [Anaerolineales bacterium]|nr:hypothetical protein [Anaerolineales bacterium]
MAKRSQKRTQTRRVDNHEYAVIGALAFVIAAIFVLQIYDFGLLGDATGTFDITVASGVGCTIDQNATIGSTAAGATADTAENGGSSGTGLVLNNTGNVDVRVDIVSNATAATLIPGTSPVFKFNVSTGVGDDVTTGADVLVNNGTNYATFQAVSTSSLLIVDNFTYHATNDTVRIDFNVTIPTDATTGTKKATITLNCTENPA